VDLFERDCLGRKRVSFVTNFVEGIFVEMDSGHLSQIIWNLLLNAVEAIEGPGTVGIETYAPNNKYVCIEVTDNGCGITDDTVRSIFDPFFTTKKKGTGLGLSIVHRILESYNSQLDVMSEAEMGATFTLKLNQALNPVKGKKNKGHRFSKAPRSITVKETT
jgi:two-component system sensor histidine kinase PilS (NtrC family)